MKSFVFRIRKRYFDAIDSGEKTVEYRRDSSFWRKRLESLVKLPNRDAWMPEEAIAVFICGKCVLRKKIIYIERIRTPIWFSEQGKKDVDTETCLAFHLAVIAN